MRELRLHNEAVWGVEAWLRTFFTSALDRGCAVNLTPHQI
jgi:hypothetical protein